MKRKIQFTRVLSRWLIVAPSLMLFAGCGAESGSEGDTSSSSFEQSRESARGEAQTGGFSMNPATAARDDGEPSESPPEVGATQQASVSCRSDSDCRTVAIVCDTCECRAATKDVAPPKCFGQKAACAVDPCRYKTAVCQRGTCSLADIDGTSM